MTMKVERAMIEERGTPREIAERMTRLPEGEYRVFVQRVRSREETAAVLTGIWVRANANQDPAFAGQSDDDVMRSVDEEIAAYRATRRASQRSQ